MILKSLFLRGSSLLYESCNLFQIEQFTSKTQSQPLILKNDVLTTIASRFDKHDYRRLSSHGCSFMLPTELQERIQNLTNESSSVYSTFSVYERSPFVWDKINTTVSLYFRFNHILSPCRTAKRRGLSLPLLLSLAKVVY